MRHLPFVHWINFGKEKLLPPYLRNKIYDFMSQERFPNICICLRILLAIPATVASAERSFRKLKLIKNYLRATQRSIPCGVPCQIGYWIQTCTRSRIWRYYQNLCWEEDTKSVFETIVTFASISEIANCLHIISDWIWQDLVWGF